MIQLKDCLRVRGLFVHYRHCSLLFVKGHALRSVAWFVEIIFKYVLHQHMTFFKIQL